MRKAIYEVGIYTVREGPNGGWRVFVTGAEQPISQHDTQPEADAAAKRYVAADARRSAQH